MQVNQQVTFANNQYEVLLQKPSLANCQNFVDYWRSEFAGIAGIADDDVKAKALANLPDCATMLKRIEILKPYILGVKNVETGDIVLNDDIPGDLAYFLAHVSMDLYSETFGFSEIKKK